MRRILILLSIVAVGGVALTAAWIFRGREISSFIDRARPQSPWAITKSGRQRQYVAGPDKLRRWQLPRLWPVRVVPACQCAAVSGSSALFRISEIRCVINTWASWLHRFNRRANYKPRITSRLLWAARSANVRSFSSFGDNTSEA